MTAYPVCGTAVRRLEHLKFKIQNLASPSSPPIFTPYGIVLIDYIFILLRRYS